MSLPWPVCPLWLGAQMVSIEEPEELIVLFTGALLVGFFLCVLREVFCRRFPTVKDPSARV